MCFDLDSHPPITPVAGASVERKSLELTSSDGTRFGAFHAMPASRTGKAIVILPDVRGLHHYYEELAVRFAEVGVDAVAIDYFGRTAGIGSRGEDFDYGAHVPQTTWAGLSADIAAAVEYLRSGATPAVARPIALDAAAAAPSIFTIGFCMGGRNAFLSGTLGLGLAGVIGFYGWPVGPARNDTPAPAEMVGRLECPVLGIFGGADQGIQISAVQTYRDALAQAGVDHDIVVEPGAPHSFFDRKQAEFQAQSDDAWARVRRFVDRSSAN
jgi:carboxymethylenebutenolidase